MSRPKKKIDQLTLVKAEEALKTLENSKVAIQLKAIIASANYPGEIVAEIFQVSLRSIFRWADKFKHSGLEELKDKAKGHLSSKLTDEHKITIERWILSGKNWAGKSTHWTLKKLQKEVYEVFNVRLSTTAVWNHLRKMKLVVKKPRPEHLKADKEKQEAFKKKLKK